MPLKQPPRPKRKIVHLGNVGEDKAYRSKELAKRFPDFEFYGIDLKSLKDRSILHEDSIKLTKQLKELRERRLVKKKPDNFKQMKTNFINGLNQFKDSTLDLVTSDFALGYYKEEKGMGGLLETIKKSKEIHSQAYNGSLEYTNKVIKLIHRKLKSRGKVIIYFYDTLRYRINLESAFRNDLFVYKIEKVDVFKIKINESRTESRFNSFYLLERKQHPEEIYRIIAIKK